MWKPTYWQGIFQYNFNNYEMTTIGSGTKGDILPVTKTDIRLLSMQVISQ
ncbi:hypothetical protein [Streptococcus infantis]